MEYLSTATAKEWFNRLKLSYNLTKFCSRYSLGVNSQIVIDVIFVYICALIIFVHFECTHYSKENQLLVWTKTCNYWMPKTDF